MLCEYYYICGVETFHIPSVPNKILVFDNRSVSSLDEELHFVGGISIAVDSIAKRTGGNRVGVSLPLVQRNGGNPDDPSIAGMFGKFL